ncbi:36.4 kDa proline-rich protein-like [Vicia villosa]|uniref:36.4 kDa proline-rich protein-like n=1 Tax=Vicia villosa TaxID=3911 RepID=UPI00273B8E01|nr:36.4 kDa proline-rich protein-like [Vicia villosa]
MPSSKSKALFFIIKLLMLNIITPVMIHACGTCTPNPPPHHHHHKPSHPKHPPHHGGGKGRPVVTPPPVVVVPPIIVTPPLLPPPTIIYPPPTVSPVFPPPVAHPTCPIDALKLGVCLDVLGGLVHVGIGNPVENECCPVIHGLLDLEAALCLCTVIRAKVLNLNIFLPLALQVLVTCGKTPPPGFVCPPL